MSSDTEFNEIQYQIIEDLSQQLYEEQTTRASLVVELEEERVRTDKIREQFESLFWFTGAVAFLCFMACRR